MDDRKREGAAKRPQDDPAIAEARRQQHTGNHPEGAAKDRPYGADEFGGTRAGAENVEPADGGRRRK